MLKRIATILLLLLLVFNWVGYRLVAGLQALHADNLLEIKIDSKDYDEATLIELRVPLNMPYINEQPEFERHYGEIELNGKYYKYVKRKIENGQLVLKCIPDHYKQQIANNTSDYFKDVAGLGADQGKKQNNNVVKINFGEYDDLITSFDIHPTGLLRPGLMPSSIFFTIPEVFIKAPAQPPDHIV